MAVLVVEEQNTKGRLGRSCTGKGSKQGTGRGDKSKNVKKENEEKQQQKGVQLQNILVFVTVLYVN